MIKVIFDLDYVESFASNSHQNDSLVKHTTTSWSVITPLTHQMVEMHHSNSTG